jgi:hypothetical protein
MTLRRSILWLLVGFGTVFVWAIIVYAHGGGLDAYGCHNNRKTGGYHCHRGPLAGESFSSKEEMLRKGSGNSGSKEKEAEKRRPGKLAN